MRSPAGGGSILSDRRRISERVVDQNAAKHPLNVLMVVAAPGEKALQAPFPRRVIHLGEHAKLLAGYAFN